MDDIFEVHTEILDACISDEEYRCLSPVRQDVIDEIFDFDNFFPDPEKRSIEPGGSWIRIPTETGFDVRFAKPWRRTEFPKVFIREKTGFDISRPKLTLKQFEAISNEQVYVPIAALIMQQYLFIWREKYGKPFRLPLAVCALGKRKKLYLQPKEFEVVGPDFMRIAEWSYKPGSGVTFHRIFNERQDKDRVHYLMSRGIPRKQSEVMVSMETGMFKVDMNTIFA